MFIFNSRKTEYKPHFGALKAGESLVLKLQSRDGIYVHQIWLELAKEGQPPVLHPMEFLVKNNHLAEFKIGVTLSSAGIYWYRFIADTERGFKILGKGESGNVKLDSENWYQQTVCDRHYETPEQLKGGVIYHIFIDRFNKGKDSSAFFDKKGAVLKQWHEDVTIVDSDGVFRANDFYGGNLQGIIDKLEYIKSLGTNIIYLSPIFESSSNHRYDTADYMAIDRLLGDEQSFERLIKAARDMGIVIMLDGVFNHTGADSKYFNKFGNYDNLGAYQGIKSPYFDWYYFTNFPDEYGCWWGITVTPTVNKRIESYRRFIFGKGGVIDKWTRLGLGGWRLDVVDELDKDFVDEIRIAVKNVDSNALVIGEVWEDASIKMAYGTLRPYLLGHQLDGVMNYPFKEATLNYLLHGNKASFIDSVMAICENYPKQALDCCMSLIGTHDTARALNILSGANMDNTSKKYRLNYRLTPVERARGIKLMKLASLIQYILPGLPTIFYGDEVGMEGFEDPINRRPFDWDDIDYELLSHYRSLARMRIDNKDIFCGVMTAAAEGELLVITRKSLSGSIITYINMTDHNINVERAAGRATVTGERQACSNAITGEKLADVVTIKAKDYLVVRQL